VVLAALARVYGSAGGARFLAPTAPFLARGLSPRLALPIQEATAATLAKLAASGKFSGWGAALWSLT